MIGITVKRAAILFVALTIAAACYAHVGSPDVYFQGDAGPYRLVVAVMTPQMIPGVAEIQIRASEPGVRRVKIVPLYIVGEASKYPPPPDVLEPSKDDPQFFSGKLWLMASGSWQVRVEAEGEKGSGTLAVPVPAAARATLPMQRGLGVLLSGLVLLLVAAIVSIMGAARREGELDPGLAAAGPDRRGARAAMAATLAIVVVALALGGWWWKAEAASRADRMIYKRPELLVSLNGDQMMLRIRESGWHALRQEVVSTRLMPDHGHLMHLFLIRMPQMDRFYHLHPAVIPPPADEGGFVAELPPIVAGRYQVFADIVRASGFPDTLIAETYIPETAGRALTGDDSEVSAVPLAEAGTGAAAASNAGNLVSPLEDGARMVWEREAGPLRSNQLLWFRFRVEGRDGKPVNDLEPYMGMAGHAEFVRSDFSVFAHVHPDGSAPMAAVMLAEKTLKPPAATNSTPGAVVSSRLVPAGNLGAIPAMPMPETASGLIGSEVSFPYGFPKAGTYRIFVQVKRGGRVETGVFDAQVD